MMTRWHDLFFLELPLLDNFDFTFTRGRKISPYPFCPIHRQFDSVLLVLASHSLAEGNLDPSDDNPGTMAIQVLQST